MHGISYCEHMTNYSICEQVNVIAGRQEVLLSTVKCRELSSADTTLPKTILQRTVKSGHRSGKPRISWNDNIKKWITQSLS